MGSSWVVKMMLVNLMTPQRNAWGFRLWKKQSTFLRSIDIIYLRQLGHVSLSCFHVAQLTFGAEKHKLKAVQTWLPWQLILQSFEKEINLFQKKRKMSLLHSLLYKLNTSKWVAWQLQWLARMFMSDRWEWKRKRKIVKRLRLPFAEHETDIQICSWAESMALKFTRKDEAVLHLCHSIVSPIHGT